MKTSLFTLPATLLTMAFASSAYAWNYADEVRITECETSNETSRDAVEVRMPVELVPARGVEVTPRLEGRIAPGREAPVAREAEVRASPECRMVDGRCVCR